MTKFSSRIESGGEVRAVYRRSDGLHEFTTTSGDNVTVASAANWADFMNIIEDNVDKLSEIVLSPELITSDTLNLKRIATSPDLKYEIEGRVKRFRALSKKARETTFLLGTAQYDRKLPGATNSLLSIQNSKVIKRVDKSYVEEGSAEKMHFRQGALAEYVPHMGRSALLVCSDMTAIAQPLFIEEKLEMAPEVDTLLVSACWANSMEENQTAVSQINTPDEVRFKRTLEWCVERAFEGYPQLQDIVVSDREPPESKIKGPLNSHFYRS